MKFRPMVVGFMKICLKEGAVLYRIAAARQVPIRLRNKSEKTLDEMLAQGVIELHFGPIPL